MSLSTVLRRGATAAALAALVTVGGASAALAAAPSEQDLAYAASNAQTNLAEIAIGTLALERGSNAETLELAEKTLADHTAALALLTAGAAEAGVDLPDAPSPEQQAQAATLKSVSDAAFDATYAQIQVAGHQKSVASTQKQIAEGADPGLIAYATAYLPIAQHHLMMAEKALAAAGGAPAAVPAGSAGLMGTADGSGQPLAWMVGAAGLALIGGGAMALRRRERADAHA